MKTKFEDLSLPFVMDLSRIKQKAEQRNDSVALANLKSNYPELFSQVTLNKYENIEQSSTESIKFYTMLDCVQKLH